MAYTKTNWQNLPNQTTPINATNLNHIEQGIYDATYENGVNVSNEVDDTYRVNLIGSRNLFDLSYRVYTPQALSSVSVSISNGVLTASISSGAAHNCYVIPVEIGKKYTIKWTNATGLNSVQCGNGATEVGTQYFRSYQTSDTQTITATSKTLFVNLLSSGATLTITNLQIEEGETATTYTQFMRNSMQVDGTKFTDTLNVGQLADNKNRVNVLHSKNLTDGIWENGGWSNTGEKRDSPSFMRTANPIYVKPNTTYTLKISESNNQIVVYYYSASGYIDLAFVQNTDTYTFTTPVNCVKINFRLSGQGITYTNTMLNEGSIALPYEEFVQNQIVVDNEKYTDTLNVGASLDSRNRVNVLYSHNLFDEEFRQGSENDTTATGYIFTKNNFVLKAGTYTFSNDLVSSYQYAIFGKTSPFPNGSSAIYNSGWKENNLTFTISQDLYIAIIIRKSDSSNITPSSVSGNKLMLNEGSTALPYEEFIQNQIVVDNEKYTDTLNVGTSLDSRNRVNILKGEQLYNSSNVEIGKTWQGNANNNRARLVLPISPNETYNIRVKGSGVAIAVIETTGTPTSSSTSNATYTPAINTQLTGKATSTTTYLTLQLDAGTTFTTAILNSLEISIYYGTGSIYVDNEEIYSKASNEYSTTEQRIGTYLGKPLYRKVVEYTSTISGGNWTGVAFSTLGLSNIDFLRIPSALGKSGNTYEEMVSNQNRILINNGNSTLSLYLTDGSFSKITFILEYTKTTD